VGEVNAWLARSPYGQGAVFDDAWLAPFLEFRFPRLGEADIAGVHLELRQAIEPWHVLGEEASSGGTARYVDSSVERVQISATGLVEGRHVVTCNGVPIPLVGDRRRPRERRGAASAIARGLRGRRCTRRSACTRRSSSTWWTRWNARSLGGFTYHVTHPGGRSYADFPVNAVAAESRRSSRFTKHGHSSGPVDIGGWRDAALLGPPGSEYPTTLDLRRFTPGNPPPAERETDN
jgi:uncharacterized protein (DUF2126 family)